VGVGDDAAGLIDDEATSGADRPGTAGRRLGTDAAANLPRQLRAAALEVGDCDDGRIDPLGDIGDREVRGGNLAADEGARGLLLGDRRRSGQEGADDRAEAAPDRMALRLGRVLIVGSMCSSSDRGRRRPPVVDLKGAYGG
jgi:hypothetical protein